MRIINFSQFIQKSQSLGFSQVQRYSQRLFFCHTTGDKIKSLQLKHLGEPSSHKISPFELPILKQVHASSTSMHNLSKSQESIKEPLNSRDHLTPFLTFEELAQMYQSIESDEVDLQLKEKILQQIDEDAKRFQAAIYADPKLDVYIEAHQGKIENIEEFNLANLAHQARLGKLDPETSKKVFQAIDDELDALNQQVLEENKSGFTGYEGAKKR
ncbi:MAG: hypothetical protein QRY71_01915 [Candidatus Rhabdochlamydia sp.]